MRPAQRAVPRVQEQVVQLGAPDQRHIARRGGAQAGPELCLRRITGPGEQLLHPAHNRLAAGGVQVAAVAIEFGRACNAQAVALLAGVAREDELEFIVRQADLVGHGGVFHRHGHRITLGRINGQRHAQRLRQQRAVRAHGQHKGVAAHPLETALGGGHFHVVDRTPCRTQCGDVLAQAELHTGLCTQIGQLADEQVGVARFIFGRKGGARQLGADMGQGWFDAYGLVGADHLAFAAQLAHLLCGAERAVKFLLVGIEMQDALGALVVLDAGVAAQLLQGRTAVGAQAHDLLDVVACARRRAFAQELQAPEPLAQVGAHAKQQGRIFLAQPLQHLERRAGVGPGFRVADGDLPAIGKAGFGAGRCLAVDDGHLVAALLEVISRGNAEQAGAENDYAHFWSLSGFQRLMDKR